MRALSGDPTWPDSYGYELWLSLLLEPSQMSADEELDYLLDGNV